MDTRQPVQIAALHFILAVAMITSARRCRAGVQAHERHTVTA